MSELLELCAGRPVETFVDSAVLLEAGATTGRLYVLRSGGVTIERDGVAFARIDAPGAVFGEMAVVLGGAATATVRAAGPVEVYVVDDGERFLRETPDAAFEILRMTAARLDGLTHYLVDVKQQFAEQAGHLGMVGDILDVLVHHQAPRSRPGSARDPEC